MPDDHLDASTGPVAAIRCPAPSVDATGRGMPVDAGTIEMTAVTTGPEVRELRGRRRRGKGLGITGWLSIGWIALVVGLALLAPVLPLDDPRESITAIARRGPFADAGSAPGHLLGGDGNGRDMLVAPDLGRTHHVAGRHPGRDDRPGARRRAGSDRRLLPRQGRRGGEWLCSTCSSPSPR